MFRVGNKSLSLNAVEVFRVVGENMNMSRAAVDTWNSRLRKLVRSLTL